MVCPTSYVTVSRSIMDLFESYENHESHESHESMN